MKKFPILGKKKKYEDKFYSQAIQNLLPRINQSSRISEFNKNQNKRISNIKESQINRVGLLQNRLRDMTNTNIKQNSKIQKKDESSDYQHSSFKLQKSNSKNFGVKVPSQIQSNSNCRLKKVFSRRKKNKKIIQFIKDDNGQNNAKENRVIQELKILFSQIQDKLKSSPEKQKGLNQMTFYHRSQSLTNLRNVSELFNNGASCSVMTSPRDIFKYKSETIKDIHSIISSLPEQFKKLQQYQKKSELNFKNYIIEKIHHINLNLLTQISKNKKIEDTKK